MNVRKPVDYSTMYRELTAIIAQNLPQMEEIYAIGKGISQRPEKGAAVAAAKFLQANFPDRTGFSPRNVRRMRDFYKVYENDEPLLRLAMKIGWTLNVVIMEAELTRAQRISCLQRAGIENLSKKKLLEIILNDAFEEEAIDERGEICYNITNSSERNAEQAVPPPKQYEKRTCGDMCHCSSRNGALNMELFPKQPQAILDELTTLENMMPSYRAELINVSKFIRNKIWGKIDDNVLLGILTVCNTVFSFKIEAFGQEFEFISDYVVAFANAIKNHSSLDIYGEFLTFLKGLWNGQFKTAVLKQWRQMNPLCQSEFTEDELYDKSILQIMDDFWGTLTPESEKAFLHPLKAYPKLVRGRKHQWTKAEDLAAPSLEAIEKYHILNRWTPPGKRYLYLVDANDPSQSPEKICMEEMRITDPALDVTIADFTVCSEALENKVLDLDYDDVSEEEIVLQHEFCRAVETGQIIQELNAGTVASKSRIKKQIRKHRTETQNFATIYCGRLFLKQICSAIFTPLDSKEDTDDMLKEKCYKSFHLLAEWCEGKGISGIRYPSTRMKLINERGSNLVLFDADSAKATETSFRVRRIFK